MDTETDKKEAQEQAELRKRLLEEAAKAKAHRAAGAPEEKAHHAPIPEWKPPRESVAAGGGRVLLRFVIFLLLLGGVYFLLRQGSLILFGPALAAVEPVVPEGRVAPAQPLTAGIRVANSKRLPASASIVVVLPSGGEVAGPVVEVPGNDTALVSASFRLPPGDHVLTLIAFAGDRRMETFRGLRVWVGDREIELGEIALPATLARSDTVVVEISATNPLETTETVSAVLSFQSGDGTATEVDGPPREIAPGETTTLQVTVVAANLEPGQYEVQVLARTPQGERLAQSRRPIPVEVRD